MSGDIIRLKESEWGFTSALATEKLQGMFYRALLAGNAALLLMSIMYLLTAWGKKP
jgi:hypothetical protein